MEYQINYQYRPKGDNRPQDEPWVDVSGKSMQEFFTTPPFLPNVGDHVYFMQKTYCFEKKEEIVKQIEGVVESRLFMLYSEKNTCINIVVTDSEHPSEYLIKS